jgi:hypothetical protein
MIAGFLHLLINRRVALLTAPAATRPQLRHKAIPKFSGHAINSQ